MREAARIQTFPDWFRFAGTRSHVFQQIGNAVPPRLGEAAATALRPLPDAPKNRLNPWRALRNRLTDWAASSGKVVTNVSCLGPNWELRPQR